MQFCRFVASVYPHMPTNFGLFILIFNKMVLIFLAVLIVFYRFELLMMSGPNSPNLNPLDYAGVLTQAATEAKTSYLVLKCT